MASKTSYRGGVAHEGNIGVGRDRQIVKVDDVSQGLRGDSAITELPDKVQPTVQQPYQAPTYQAPSGTQSDMDRVIAAKQTAARNPVVSSSNPVVSSSPQAQAATSTSVATGKPKSASSKQAKTVAQQVREVNQPMARQAATTQVKTKAKTKGAVVEDNLAPDVKVKENKPVGSSGGSSRKSSSKAKAVNAIGRAQEQTNSKQFRKENEQKRRPNPARDVDTGQIHTVAAPDTPSGVVGIGQQRHVTEMPLQYGGELPINAIVKANLEGGPLVRKGRPGVLAGIDGRTFEDLFPEDNAGYVTPEGVAYPGQQPINAIVKANLGETSIVPSSESSEFAAEEGRPWTQEGPTRPWMASEWGTADQKLLEGYRDEYSYTASREEDDKRKEDEIIADSISQQAANVDWGAMHPNAAPVDDFGYTSFEEYTKDYEEGRRDRDQYGQGDVGLGARIKASVYRIVMWIREAYIPLESQHIDENGNIRFSDETEAAIVNYMNHMGYAPQERYMVMHQAMKAIGYTPDRNGLFLGEEKAKVPDFIFREALNNMMLSCELYGHPYGFVNKGLFLGNTRCYPIGVMTFHEAEMLCKPGKLFEGQDPADLVSKAAATWVNETYPAIKRDAFRYEKGEAQLAVIEDAVRALCSLDSISPRLYGVADEVDRGYDEMMNDTYRRQSDEDDRLVSEQQRNYLIRRKQRAERAAKRLDRRRNKTALLYDEDVVDANGEISHRKGERVRPWHEVSRDVRVKEIRNSKKGGIDAVCMSVANMAKFAGVVGYVPIMGSAVLEHAQGAINTKVANAILFWGSDAFRPNAAMYDHVTSEAGVEAIAAWKTLLQVGGQDAVTLFYEENPGKPLNKENVAAFLNDMVNRTGPLADSDSRVAKIIKNFAAKRDEITKVLMPGDAGFGKVDARRWLEGFMINNMMNSRDPVGMEHSFTSQEVLEMMDAMGVERFLAAATSMNAGRDAMLMVRNQTLDRQSPLTHVCDTILRSSGVTNAAVTLCIDTYFTYGLNLIQNMLPFSNTFSFLAVRFGNWAYKGCKTGDWSGRDNLDVPDIDLLSYQMGGLDKFGAGLRKNIIYDCAKLGNITLIGGFMSFVLAALGFEEPPDEMNKYVWSEYLIGKNIGLGKDENGVPHGIPIYQAWWLNDLTLFAMPMAYALNASTLDQQLGEKDPDLANKLFFDGCYDMLTGASLLDMVKLVNNAQADFATYEQMMDDPKADCPPDWFSFGMMQAELVCARGVNKLIPNMLKNMRTDSLFVGDMALNHTPYKVYDRDSDTPGKTESVQDWFELQRRIESRYNVPYALFNNITKNGYWLDDGSTTKTGYLFDEMPLSTAKDPARMAYANMFAYDPDNIPGGEANRIPYTEEKIQLVLDNIKQWNSPEEAVNHGFMIPAQLRYKMRDFCYQNINFEENLYNQRVQEGYYKNSAAKNDGYTRMQNQKEYWYDVLNNWVFNSDIPWSDEGYVQHITSYQDVYYFKDTGKPATITDYWQLGDDAVEQRFVPRGDHPSSFALFTTPDTRGRGYNFETVANWYNEGESGTDVQKVFDMLQGKTVPYGRDEGVYANTAVFGGSPNFKTSGEPIESEEYKAMNKPTMGYRSYLPYEESMLYDLPNAIKKLDPENYMDSLKSKKREDVDGNSSLGDMGKYVPKDSWKTSSYPSYGSRGYSSYGRRSYGSSGGHSPRIYHNLANVYAPSTSSANTSAPRLSSSPRTANADRAATMYSKTPQDARIDSYLRPAYSTKGSREAHKRQDI